MRAPDQLTPERILQAVAAHAGADPAELASPPEGKRPGLHNQLRRRVVFLTMRLRPDVTLRTLGLLLGRRENDAVHSASIAAERRFETDPAEQQAVREILERLGVDALPERSAPSWRRPTPGEHVCEACQGAAVFGQGRTWFCVRCVPADFLPIERRAS